MTEQTHHGIKLNYYLKKNKNYYDGRSVQTHGRFKCNVGGWAEEGYNLWLSSMISKYCAVDMGPFCQYPKTNLVFHISYAG